MSFHLIIRRPPPTQSNNFTCFLVTEQVPTRVTVCSSPHGKLSLQQVPTSLCRSLPTTFLCSLRPDHIYFIMIRSSCGASIWNSATRLRVGLVTMKKCFQTAMQEKNMKLIYDLNSGYLFSSRVIFKKIAVEILLRVDTI